MSGKSARAVAMLTGSLDSLVAARLVQMQGIKLIGLYVETPFACGSGNLASAAEQLNIEIERRAVSRDYLELWRHPRFGFGRGANPCTDCHVYLFTFARRLMEETESDFVVSGEVLGQKPRGQRRRDLMAVEEHSGLRDRLLRPLSAKLLPETLAEQAGVVDRKRLESISSSGRRSIELLARDHLGLDARHTRCVGCRLGEAALAGKVREMFAMSPQVSLWEAALVNVGRHVRLASREKVILSRNADEAESLSLAHRTNPTNSSILTAPANFRGPTALLIGSDLRAAIRLLADRVKFAPESEVEITGPGSERQRRLVQSLAANK